jgi:HEAT repeat protein
MARLETAMIKPQPPYAPSDIPMLLEELHHLNDEIRWFAARALGAIDDPSAIPALIQALSD